MQPLRHFLLALQFFSRLPVTGRLAQWVGWSPELQRASAAHLPGVGWIVGLATGAAVLACNYLLAQHPMLPWVSALLCTVVGIAMTGGFHEDGMADVADGLGGHLPAEQALQVMKDSRLGSYGVMALCLGLITKIIGVAWLVMEDVASAALLVCTAHVLSRAAPLVLMRTLPHVSLPATSKTLHIAGRPLSNGGLFTGALWCVPAVVALWWYVGPVLLTAVLLVLTATTAYMGWRFHRRLHGMTGDCLGATQQMCEWLVYFTAAFVLAQCH